MRKEKKDEKSNTFKKIPGQSGLVRWWGVVDQLRSIVEGWVCVCVCVLKWTEKGNKFKRYYIAEVRSNEVPTCLRLMTEKIKRGSM